MYLKKLFVEKLAIQFFLKIFIKGVPQFIKFALREKLESKISKILLKVQFQGGFCGKECQIELLKDQTDIAVLPFYPKGNF